MLTRGQSGFLEVLLEVLNADFLQLRGRAKHFTKVRDRDMGNVQIYIFIYICMLESTYYYQHIFLMKLPKQKSCK